VSLAASIDSISGSASVAVPVMLAREVRLRVRGRDNRRMPLRRRRAALSLCLALPGVNAWAKPQARAHAARPSPHYARHAGALAFAAQAAAQRGLDPAWVEAQLARAQRLDAVRRLIMPAPTGTPKNWAAYRARFIEPQRVQAGVDFLRTHTHWLQLAEHRWGVPPQIVAGIIGVETFYGRVTGNFRVLDALATLAFDFPPGRSDRSAFFRAELLEFFVLCAREGLDPLGVKGSYAGAMGLPQFMPGSVNRRAVDLDGDGRIDLLHSAADAVGSVAHYLAAAGWERGMPTHYAVQAPQDDAARAALLVPDIVPTFSAAQFAQMGAVLDDAGRAHGGPLALVALQNGAADNSYVAGTRNFHAITRYNASSYYAMAVIELGQAVAEALALMSAPLPAPASAPATAAAPAPGR
jgi:membrane-bound lytic murein transglycosylase B